MIGSCNYNIHILVAADYEADPLDGLYTTTDRSLLKADAAAHGATVIFKEIAMYSGDALEPGTNTTEIARWNTPPGYEGSVVGRPLGYRSMCRLWSGRLQSMSFLQPYRYYMRLDDDSYFTADLPFDPFKAMHERSLQYAWRRDAQDSWGIEKLWKVAEPLLLGAGTRNTYRQLWAPGGRYNGGQPYNNFHVSSVALWQSPRVRDLWARANDAHLFYKYRVGDANYHAMVVMLLGDGEIQRWQSLPYVHNTNDDSGYPRKEHAQVKC